MHFLVPADHCCKDSRCEVDGKMVPTVFDCGGYLSWSSFPSNRAAVPKTLGGGRHKKYVLYMVSYKKNIERYKINSKFNQRMFVILVQCLYGRIFEPMARSRKLYTWYLSGTSIYCQLGHVCATHYLNPRQLNDIMAPLHHPSSSSLRYYSTCPIQNADTLILNRHLGGFKRFNSLLTSPKKVGWQKSWRELLGFEFQIFSPLLFWN